MTPRARRSLGIIDSTSVVPMRPGSILTSLPSIATPTPTRADIAPAERPSIAIPAPEIESRTEPLQPWTVILHNDDVNTMDYVVVSLLKAVPQLKPLQAMRIMLEAHHAGRARVIACPLELAELYRDRLQTFGLTATIEKG